MKLKSILAAVALQFLVVAAALGAGTQTTALSTAGGASPAYTDLGAAPLQVQAIGGDIRIVVSDSAPALTLAGNLLPQGQYQTFNLADAGSHVWAIGLNGAPSASYAPIYASGSGGSVTQGTSPWVVSSVGAATFATGQATSIGTSAGSIVAARTGAPGTGRVSVTLYNQGAVTVYYGPSGVTTLTGTPLLPGGSRTIQTTAQIFGVVASGTGSIAYDETY